MFKDRSDAGHRLGKRLLRYKDRQPVVLAIPRGGVAVACEIARILDAALDVLPVRKIALPGHPERAAGAVVDGAPPQVIALEPTTGPDATAQFGQAAEHHLAEVQRHRTLYVGDRRHREVKGRLVILVDDGVVTGVTVRAAARALRQRSPQRIVLAVPVAPAGVLDALSAEVDDVVCLMTPAHLEGIGHYYGDVHKIHDDQVIALLRGMEKSKLAHGR